MRGLTGCHSIYIDGYFLFWILGLYHIPYAMYSSFEELQQVRSG